MDNNHVIKINSIFSLITNAEEKMPVVEAPTKKLRIANVMKEFENARPVPSISSRLRDINRVSLRPILEKKNLDKIKEL